MGRGRAKAKQTKVARDLKYRAVDTDFTSLARELRGESYSPQEDISVLPDPYVELAAEYDPAADVDEADERRSS